MVVFGKIMSNSTDNSQKKNELFAFMSQKNKIEMEIKQLFEILSTNNVGLFEPLVDQEGFPRNDIDVYQVRTARHKIICLQNDHKSIMSKIETGLHELHAGTSEESAMDCSTAQDVREPFARVSLVSPSSPADICGLNIGDLILEFGSVNKNNFKSLSDIAAVVRHSAGQKVVVAIQRPGRHSPLSLDLVPQPWSGQGLIGCKIDPLLAEVVER